MKRVKSLFIAASIIAIVIGSIQIAGNILNFGSSGTQTAQAPAVQLRIKIETAVRSAAPEPTASRSRQSARSAEAVGHAAARTAGRQHVDRHCAVVRHDDAGDAILVQPADARAEPRHHRIDFPPRQWPAGATDSARKQPSQDTADQLPAAIGGPRLRSAAVAGDAAAAYEVAMRYAEGRGVPANMEEAARWYERAANKGLAPAQFRYASLLEKGQGVKKDLPPGPPALSCRRRQRQRQGDA